MRVYVGEQLRAYANGTRVFPLMHAMAAPLSAQDVADLAVNVHGRKDGGFGAAPAVPQALLERGRALNLHGLPGQATSCAECHGDDVAGRTGRSPEIAGEPLPYLQAQLRTLRDKGRMGTVAAETMAEEAHKRRTPTSMRSPPTSLPSSTPARAGGPRRHRARDERPGEPPKVCTQRG